MPVPLLDVADIKKELLNILKNFELWLLYLNVVENIKRKF